MKANPKVPERLSNPKKSGDGLRKSMSTRQLKGTLPHNSTPGGEHTTHNNDIGGDGWDYANFKRYVILGNERIRVEKRPERNALHMGEDVDFSKFYEILGNERIRLEKKAEMDAMYMAGNVEYRKFSGNERRHFQEGSERNTMDIIEDDGNDHKDATVNEDQQRRFREGFLGSSLYKWRGETKAPNMYGFRAYERRRLEEASEGNKIEAADDIEEDSGSGFAFDLNVFFDNEERLGGNPINTDRVSKYVPPLINNGPQAKIVRWILDRGLINPSKIQSIYSHLGASLDKLE